MKHTHNQGGYLFKNYLIQPIAVDALQLFQVFEGEYTSPVALNLSDYSTGCFLLYCMSGEGVLRSEQTTIPLEKEGLILCSEKERFTVESTNRDQVVRCLGIHFQVLNKPYASTQSTLELYFANSSEIRTAKQTYIINDVISQLISELSLPQPSVMMVRSVMMQVLVLAYRAFSSHLLSSNQEETSLNAVGHTVYAIIRYVDEHLFTMHNLMGMAQELGYSYNYLSHLFRRKTGMTIQTYVSRKKIDISMELLSDDSLSITEIAAKLNYDCIQSFSKAFRRSMGMSPTEYRAKLGLKNI